MTAPADGRCPACGKVTRKADVHTRSPQVPAEGRTPPESVKVRAWKLLEANGYAYLEAGEIVQWLDEAGLFAASASETPPPRRQVVIEDWLRKNAYLILDEDRRIMLCARVGGDAVIRALLDAAQEGP